MEKSKGARPIRAVEAQKAIRNSRFHMPGSRQQPGWQGPDSMGGQSLEVMGSDVPVRGVEELMRRVTEPDSQ